MKKSIKAVTLFLFIINSVLFAAQSPNKLEQNFVTPPDSAKPQTWWHWMNGNVTKEGITADLEAMKRVGLGGFEVFNVSEHLPAGPVAYMSQEWRGMMTYAVKEADRLGLEMCMHNCDGWSSSGGPWITPEYTMQKVVWTEKQIDGEANFCGQLERPEAKENYYCDIVVLAFPTPASEYKGEGFRISDWNAKAGFDRRDGLKCDSRKVDKQDIISSDKIVVLTSNMDSSGNLRWQVPAGKWTIVRFGYTPTGAHNSPATTTGRGLECDKLSREAAKISWQNTVQNVIDDAGGLSGKTFNNVLIDSYEMRCQNWTAKFPQAFKKQMGYDIISYLPVLTGRVVGSMEISERILWDFRKVITDMFVDNYYSYFAEMCHKNGLKLSIEPYGDGNFDEFMVASKADIPMGEWWAQSGEDWLHWSVKLAASAAHTNGRKYVGAESFTTGSSTAGFTNYPYILKSQGDYFYCQGVNRFIFHTYVHQPWMNVVPGMTMGQWGGQFNRNNTWFEKSSQWLKYIARCQYLLQEGRFVADLCYFAGEDSPNRLTVRRDIRPVPPAGYDYDFCTAENLMQMTVKDGNILLPSGMSYRMLILPSGNMRPAVLKQISKLVKAGAIVYGDKPANSPSLANYPACDNEIKKLTEELWDGGKIITGKPLADVLTSKGIRPDFEFSGGLNDEIPTLFPSSGVEYIHRKIDGVDVYFVSNQHQEYKLINATFRVKGMQPEIWRPDTGEITKAAWYSFTDNGTVVPLPFEPAGSVFVIFRDKSGGADRIESVVVDNKKAANTGDIKTPKLEIKHAVYGDINGSSERQVDVTEKLKAMVKANRLLVAASNNIAGDPASGIVKRMKVDYLLDGKEFSRTVSENQPMVLPESYKISEDAGFEVKYQNDKISFLVSRSGRYTLQRADGTKKIIDVNVPEPTTIDGSWTLRFPAGWGAPEEITLDKLIDWTDHENYDVKHFSGTATYSKDFEFSAAPDEKLYLDLGTVNVIASVKLNGKDMGILWKAPFKVEVTDIIKSGSNHLEIEVTNLWANRLIGDAKYPADCERRANNEGPCTEFPKWVTKGGKKPDSERKTFVAWQHWNANSSLFPSGLLGPVRVIKVKIED